VAILFQGLKGFETAKDISDNIVGSFHITVLRFVSFVPFPAVPS